MWLTRYWIGQWENIGYSYESGWRCKSDGLLVNTWEELDTPTLKAMREERGYGSVPVSAVGPLIKPVIPLRLRSGLLDWLDEQPVESVIYISFGSAGVLSAQQITELAWALELSQ